MTLTAGAIGSVPPAVAAVDLEAVGAVLVHGGGQTDGIDGVHLVRVTAEDADDARPVRIPVDLVEELGVACQ